MNDKTIVYIVDDNARDVIDVMDKLLSSDFEIVYFRDFNGILEQIEHDFEQKRKAIIVIDLNMPYYGSEFSKKEKEKSSHGKFTGWVWLYKNIISNKLFLDFFKKIIIYSAYCIDLEERYFVSKDLKEYQEFKNNVIVIDKLYDSKNPLLNEISGKGY